MSSDIHENDEPRIDEERQRYMRMSMSELMREAAKARHHCEEKMSKKD